MAKRIDLQILPQPTESTCGPTCLHALYAYHDDPVPLAQVVEEVGELEQGGTLGVMLGVHALRRGWRAKIYTYNLQVFDPTWFQPGASPLRRRLEEQIAAKNDPKVRLVSRAYLEYLERGGEVELQDLTRTLVREPLKRGWPMLVGLSSTWLYQSAREIDRPLREDDVLGEPQGHFVVLCGYDKKRRTVAIADPLHTNPVSGSPYYDVGIDRLVTSILLGTLTYDANLVLIRPARSAKEPVDDDPDRRR
jgi:hypothetical protein